MRSEPLAGRRSRRVFGVLSLLLTTSCGHSLSGPSRDAGPNESDDANSERDATAVDGNGAVDASIARDAKSATDAVSDAGALVVSHSRILFDTDMGPDVDDAGALAVLNVLANRGEVDLLGVGLSIVGDGHTPAISFVDAVNTYYGHPDVPVGIWKGKSFVYVSPYTTDVATNPALYPHDHGDSNDDVRSAAALYRHVLAGELDQSVTMVCVGPMNNLLALLDAPPDDDSTLDGAALVTAKVARLVQMGGDTPTGNEFNFGLQPDPGTTAAVLDRWPTPIVFTGFALGAEIITGSSLADTPASNPVRRAYEMFTGSLGGVRQSWDLTAALVASEGTGTRWALSLPGTNRADDAGRNTFTPAPDGRHRYLERLAPAPAIAGELDAMLAANPY